MTVGGIPFPARAEQQGGPCPRPTWGPAHDLMSLHDRVGGVDGRGEHRALPHSLLLHRLECEAQQEGCNYPTFAIIQHTSQPAFKTSSGTSRTTLKQTSSSCLLVSATYQCLYPPSKQSDWDGNFPHFWLLQWPFEPLPAPCVIVLRPREKLKFCLFWLSSHIFAQFHAHSLVDCLQSDCCAAVAEQEIEWISNVAHFYVFLAHFHVFIF